MGERNAKRIFSSEKESLGQGVVLVVVGVPETVESRDSEGDQPASLLLTAPGFPGFVRQHKKVVSTRKRGSFGKLLPRDGVLILPTPVCG